MRLGNFEKDFHYYLLHEGDDIPEHPEAGELKTAFLCGYISALHVSRIYNSALFLRGDGLADFVKTELDWVLRGSAVFDERAIKYDPSRCLPVSRNEICWYLLKQISPDNPSARLEDAFVAGYKISLINYCSYDDCLFADSSDEAKVLIAAALLRFETENTGRYTAAEKLVLERGTNGTNAELPGGGLN